MTSTGNRERLTRAARKLFAERGFAAVSVDEIAEAAGVTKGAVYYQFADKTDVFRAACAAVLADIAAAVETSTMEEVTHTVDEIVTGAEHLFDAYESKEARRLLLIDGPAVLGFTEWSAMQQRMGLAEHAIGHLVDAGLVPRRMAPSLAQLLFGAFIQGVLQISASSDPGATSRLVRASYRRLAQGLLQKPR